MELIQLEYFRAVAYEESISRAARKLHISQPALSISISKLEDELGVHLFDRISGRIRLNNMGKIYLRQVERVFLDLRDAELELANQNSAKLTEIFLASSTMGMCPTIMEQYIRDNPHQPLSIFIHSDEEIKTRLENGTLDFAICARQIYGHDLIWQPLFNERLVILVPKGHPLMKKRFVEVQDLEHEKFVVQRSAQNLRGEYSSVFDNAGIEPQTSICTNELELAIRSVDAGAGIMVASFLTAARLTHNTTPIMIPLKTDSFVRNLGLLRLNGHYFTQNVQQLYDYLVSAFEKENAVQEEFFQGVYDN